jgi:hypothetical protein
MKLSKKIVAAAKRRAFPWHKRPPKGATGAVEAALRFVLDGRREGATGPQIYRRYMTTYLSRYPGCGDPACPACETDVARVQRVIIAALEAVAELEGPGA